MNTVEALAALKKVSQLHEKLQQERDKLQAALETEHRTAWILPWYDLRDVITDAAVAEAALDRSLKALLNGAVKEATTPGAKESC